MPTRARLIRSMPSTSKAGTAGSGVRSCFALPSHRGASGVRSCFSSGSGLVSRNHLTAIAYHGHPRWHTTLAYDGLDHLVTITERDGQEIETKHLIWCGEAICGLTDNKGQLITRLFQQGEWRQGQVLYYAKDHLGSIRDVLGTLPPAGELINLASYDYGPYGERLDGGRSRGFGAGGGLGMGGDGLGASSLPAEQGMAGGEGLEPEGAADGQGMGNGGAVPDGSASPELQARRSAAIQSTLGYAGMFYHARSGLYLTHYRAYDPRLGRWLSREPLGDGIRSQTPIPDAALPFLPSGTGNVWNVPSPSSDRLDDAGVAANLYFYANNNPILWLDPSGLQGVPGYPLPMDFDPSKWPENQSHPYGTTGCNYYTRRCSNSGSYYYCDIAPLVCNASPNCGWFNCSRLCLQEADQVCSAKMGGPDRVCTIGAHEACWWDCFISTDRRPPTLPRSPIPNITK